MNASPFLDKEGQKVATYTNLRRGSTGKDVEELQTGLKNAGYSIDVDGKYGPATETAVRQYQQKNSLKVDGVAGSETLGHLYGGPARQNTQMTTQPQATQKTTVQMADEALNAYLNRKDFSYDMNGDALYQQYKDRFISQGKMAMQDTMGQAAALTGGYGSSYAQSVGQQAYHGYLEGLNDVVPELYQLAYQKYQNEGDTMRDRYALLADKESQEHDRKYQAERDRVSDEQWWAQFDYQKEQDDAAAKKASEQEAQERKLAIAMIKAESGDFGPLAEINGVSEAEAKKWYVANYGDSTGTTEAEDDALRKWVYSRTDAETGDHYYYRDGEEAVFADGINPHTGTKNYDVANGTFGAGGYQPDNVKGDKLTKAGFTAMINGHEQNVWKTESGEMYLWDDKKNAYVSYPLDGQPYDEVDTAATRQFKGSIMTKRELSRTGGKYSSYEEYLEETIDNWLEAGKLKDYEAASLMMSYGLA